MLCVGSSGLRMFCTKKRSSPVRPIKSLRESGGGWEPCKSIFRMKGIGGTSLVTIHSSILYKPSVRLYYKLQYQALVIESYISYITRNIGSESEMATNR